jgi:hypothetical protein
VVTLGRHHLAHFTVTTNKSYVWTGWGFSRLHPACLLLYSCPYSLALSTNPKWLTLLTLFTTKVCANRMIIWLEKNIVCSTGKGNSSNEMCKRLVHGRLFLTMQYFRLSQQCSWSFKSMGLEYSFPDFGTGSYHWRTNMLPHLQNNQSWSRWRQYVSPECW